MASNRRVDRLNSLLKEVISEIIHRQVKNPAVSELVTVTRVNIAKDLKYAKVYISIIGEDSEREETLDALNSASGFISSRASKQVVMRFFPSLQFTLDDSVDKHLRIESVLTQLKDKKQIPPSEEQISNDA